ncbi:MAG TPA: GLPGLI family protein [Flavitalea sp.]|nr:GLPGLI family protein [Flavitalea sp.]
MKKTLLLFGFLATTIFSHAQFLVRGKIEFERKINVHKQFDGDAEWLNELKKHIPQYNITYFDFLFTGDKSLYKPGKENPDNGRDNWGEGPAKENVVYADYSKNTFTSFKKVFEQNFLVEDSLKKIQWKITSDTRKIAGFECRKATAIIMDSVYVFAFYTDEIIVSGGPESFNGLPGMILGVAIPRISTTWFATKVELTEVAETELKKPVKGKKTDLATLQTTLQTSFKEWGKYMQRNIWFIII